MPLMPPCMPKFDWDNKALSMHIKKPEYEELLSWSMPGTGPDPDMLWKTNKAIDQNQFTDKDGYWYVPVESKTGSTTYVKFNAKKALVGLAKVELDSLTKELVTEIYRLNMAILVNIFGPDSVWMLHKKNKRGN